MSENDLPPNGPVPDRAFQIDDDIWAIYRYDNFGNLDTIEYGKKPKDLVPMSDEDISNYLQTIQTAFEEWEKCESYVRGHIYSDLNKSPDAEKFWWSTIDRDSRRIYLRNAFSKWNPRWENTQWQNLPRYVRQHLSKYMNERQGKVNRVRIKRPHNQSAVVRRRRNRRWRTKFVDKLRRIFEND